MTGNVTEGEIRMIATALKPIMHYTSDGRPIQGDRANSSMSRILLNQLKGYKDWAVSNYKRKVQGTLTVGGIITPILRACNVPLKGKGTPAKMIDLGYLKNSHFFEGKIAEQKYRFIHPIFGTAFMLLPNEKLTTIRKGNNIDFQPNKEVLDSYQHEERRETAEEDNVEETDAPVDQELDEPNCYYFEEAPTTRQGKTLAAAHKNIGKLQKWNKFQDNFFTKKIKDMTSQIKKLTMKLNKATSSRKQGSSQSLERSQSITNSPRQPQVQQPHRHSSADPETVQRRKRHHSERENRGSTSQRTLHQHQLLQQHQEIEQHQSFEQHQEEQEEQEAHPSYFDLMREYLN